MLKNSNLAYQLLSRFWRHSWSQLAVNIANLQWDHLSQMENRNTKLLFILPQQELNQRWVSQTFKQYWYLIFICVSQSFLIYATDALLVTIPVYYNYPITSYVVMDGTIDGISLNAADNTNVAFGPTSFRTYVAGDDFIVSITELTPTCDDSSCISTKYKAGFNLINPAYQQTLDVTEFTCRTQEEGVDVNVASGTSGDGGTNEMWWFEDGEITSYSVDLNAASNYVQVSTDSTQAGASATLTITFLLSQPYIEESWIVMKVPKANVAYTSNNAGSAVSLITSANAGSASVSIGGTTLAINDFQYEQGSGYGVDTWALATTSTGVLSTGQTVTITVAVTNPPLVTTIDANWDLEIRTAQSDYEGVVTDAADYALYDRSVTPTASVITGLVTTTVPSKAGTAASVTQGYGETNAEYSFEIVITNAIPTQGVMILTVPVGVTVPDNDPSSFIMACTTGCNSGGSYMTYDSTLRELTITSAFTSYLTGGSTVSFSLTGWTNPDDSEEYVFSLATKFDESSTQYGIEDFTDLSITVADTSVVEPETACYVTYGNITDGDTRIYGIPAQGYLFQMWCKSPILTTYQLQITFPSEFSVMDRSSCTFALTDENYRYLCQTDSTNNIITVSSFLRDDIDAEAPFEFYVDSIINPATFEATSPITIATLDADDVQVNSGTYTFNPGYFTTGNITTFTVVPESTATNAYPVNYTFNIVPNGEISRNSYILIDLPDEVLIEEDNDFETSCGFDLYAFTNDVISCVVTDNKRFIQIKDGFRYAASTNFTDDDGLYFPPDIQFTLEGFRNPRESGYSSPWNVTIFNDNDKVLYYWTEEATPTVRMSGVNAPAYIEHTTENGLNGGLSWLEFLVTTTSPLTEGDKIIVVLPLGWYFTQDSKVYGRSNNLAGNMTSSISGDQKQIDITAELASSQITRRLDEEFLKGRELQSKIDSGLSFQFRITAMKNFISLRPSSESIEYYVYSQTGTLFEEQVTGMFLKNDEVGQLDSLQNGIIPGLFRVGFESNYTLTFEADNYEPNMIFTLYLPTEVNFAKVDPTCSRISGTGEDVLKCTTDRDAKTLSFTNAMQFANANPGQVKVLIENLQNPEDNIITSSFILKTTTYDGYAMDEVTSNITVNFYCEYPCASCPQDAQSVCETCYTTSVERYFYQERCLAQCPDGMVETEDLSCIDCVSPCLTCDGSPDSCRTCIKGYYIVNGDECREEVIWYFPFVGTALIFFILISFSELITKRKSNFKESLIAFWSLPEVGSWGTFIWFLYDRLGLSNPLYLACLAALLYICINLIHSCIHPRYMVPNALPTFQHIRKTYPCGTILAYLISYLFSFKFSLILVSNFCGSRRLQGDYSAMNWKQFNRFSLAFCLAPYLCMMGACIYFIMTDGFWSLTGFVAAEVICLSTLIAMLLLIDAISAIKCKTVGKRVKVNRETVVATGADYESDEDERNLKTQVIHAQKVTRGKHDDVFGGDDSYYDEDSSVGLKKSYRSQLSQQTQIMNEEARKQIAMLEELAHQMREEKRQLQLDKERIEREKDNIHREKDNIDREKEIITVEKVRSQNNYEQYLDGYQRQAEALNNQVREMELQKVNLVQQVEERLEQGNRANIILAKKVQEAQQKNRKNFRDFEGEMEDYEPVEEENSEEAQSDGAAVDAVQLPVLPASGVIDYYRQMDGDAQQWMQQITPRGGGISMQDELSMDGASVMHIQKDSAHFETTSVPPSRYTAEVGKGHMDAEYHDMTSQDVEANQSEMYQQRSDAEMEIDSDMQEKEAGDQEYFEPEQAIYSQDGERVERETQAEFFSNVVNPVFGEVEKPPTRHGDEQRFFSQIERQHVGEGDHTSDKLGSQIQFFKPEPPAYQMEQDNDVSKQGTQQHFFNPETAMQGEADNHQRQGLGTPEEFLNRTLKNFYSRNESPRRSVNASEMHVVNTQNPQVRDNVSNIGRSQVGEDLIYQERQKAFIDQDHADPRQMVGPSVEFMQRGNAMYAPDQSQAVKNATQHEFFKQDEAVRGDVSDDRSVAATQQAYINNIDRASQGRPDNFSRSNQTAQEFLNKSDLGGVVSGNPNAGMATPVPDKHADPIDYMNNSDAEYGRLNTVQDRQATQHEFFEQEKNPAFGRGETFTRKVNDKQEFFEPEQNPAYGRGENYTRQAQHEQEYNPEPSVDSSGASESSEGDIAHHQPFNTSSIIPKARETTINRFKPGQVVSTKSPTQSDPNVEQVKRVLAGNPNPASRFADDNNLQNDFPQASSVLANNPPQNLRATPQPYNSLGQAPNLNNSSISPQHNPQQSITPEPQRMLQQSAMQQLGASTGNLPHMRHGPGEQRPKTILYSDKSETSVEDLMDETPSNYNIQNGRFEGKSLGLKAMLLHAKNYQNQTIDPDAHSSQPVLHGLQSLDMPQQNRSPQMQNFRPALLAPGNLGAQKGIIGSQNDERQFVNNLYQSQQSIGDQSSNNQWRAGGPLHASRVQTIAAESVGDNDSQHPRNTRNQVRTKKQFAEERSAIAKKSRTRLGDSQSGRNSNLGQPSNGRAPKVTKNNYL